MSLEPILKNICLYLELLQKIRSSNDLFLTAESFRNAFQWAEYCQKIHLQSMGKPYAQLLDKEIKKLNNFPWTLGDVTIDLQFLGNSVAWLSLAVAQNDQFISRDNMLKPMLEKVCSNFEEIEELIAMNSSFNEILSMESENSKNDCNIERLKMETSSALLIDYAWKILSTASCDDSVRRMFLRDKLHHLSKSEVGLIIILRTYLSLFESQKKSHRMIFQYFDYFISRLVKMSDENFWAQNISKGLIVELCAVNEDVFRKFFDDLQRFGKSFEIHYNDVFDETSDKISLFEWRLNADSPSNISYDWLKGWIVTFFNEVNDDNVRECSAKIISGLARSSDINIWKTMLQELRRTDLLIDTVSLI